MKILCITYDGYGSPIALNLKREGNEVRLFIKDPEAREIYQGILDNEKDWRHSLPWCDFVVFLNNKLDDIWEIAHKLKPCFGGSTAGQNLEKDRPAAHKLMKSLGMQSPESLSFKTTQEVEAHIKEHKAKHVIKPTGGDTDSDDVFISEYPDGRDVLLLLKRMEAQKKKFEQIEVEEKIEGIEAGVAGYFDGKKFAPGIEINFQHKPFATGNKGNGIGFLTGEMGTLTKMVDADNAFFKKTLEPMTDYLRSIDYKGEIDVGCIVNEKGNYFIEHTPRKGYPDCVIRLETQITPEGELYKQIANGNVTESKFSKEWAIGVVYVAPGFPDDKSSQKRANDLPIFGVDENEKHCRLFEAKKDKDGYKISDGGYGLPLCVTGKGDTIQDAQRNVYWLLDPRNPNRVYVPKGFYRVDIGDRVLREKDQILKLGILSEAEWG